VSGSDQPIVIESERYFNPRINIFKAIHHTAMVNMDHFLSQKITPKK